MAIHKVPGTYYKCILRSPYIAGHAGTGFAWCGHDFIIQPDLRSAIAVIHEDFTKIEVPLGKYEILELAEEVGVAKPAAGSTPITLSNYYGCGTLEQFRVRLTELRDQGKLQGYAKQVMGADFPTDGGPRKLVDTLCQAVEAKIAEGATE